jgi:hypothetical protein
MARVDFRPRQSALTLLTEMTHCDPDLDQRRADGLAADHKCACKSGRREFLIFIWRVGRTAAKPDVNRSTDCIDTVGHGATFADGRALSFPRSNEG